MWESSNILWWAWHNQALPGGLAWLALFPESLDGEGPLGPSNCSLPGVSVTENLDCQLDRVEKCLGD